MEVKNKKAWLRIIEAFIASLILIGAVFTLALTKVKETSDLGKEIYKQQRKILELISKNSTLRSYVLNGDKPNIKSFISDIAPPSWNFSINICKIEEICSNPIFVDEEVYSTEIIITANLTYYNPKKLRIFTWIKH